MLLDAKMQVDQIDALKKEVMSLVPKIDANGDKAKKALVRLLELGMEPNGRWILDEAGVGMSCSTLMKRPDTTEEIMGLAGSLITLITDLPISSEISDKDTG